MEMEDHEVEHDQYGMSSDLRQFLNGRTTGLFAAISQPTPADHLLNNNNNNNEHQLAEMLIASRRHRHLISASNPSSNSHHHDLSPTTMAPPPPPLPPPALLFHHQTQMFGSDSTTTTTNNTNNNNNVISSGGGNIEMGVDQGGGFGCGDGGAGRWPRQETLTLLEIRARLDSKFKEANQKAPLWDELSRIMSEEHGYQRSGKKCREKFENLYKYYKKTKEGKAGRQDGKHYRFFRQLEALYGESSTATATNTTEIRATNTTYPYPTNTQLPTQEVFNHQAPRSYNDHDTSLTHSNSSAFDTSSSDDCSDLNAGTVGLNKRRGKRSWKVKIKDFIDGQMRKLMEMQEAWLEKMMKTIEHKEQERMVREEEWRKQEVERVDREHKFWTKERAWIEARDAGLMESLHKLTGIKVDYKKQNDHETVIRESGDGWEEGEIARLIQLRASMEARFNIESCEGEEVLWEEIATRMNCFGYEKSGLMCKEKCAMIKNSVMREDPGSKKRKENDDNNSCFYYQNNESICNELGAGGLGLMTRSLLTQNGHHIDHNSSADAAASNMNGSSYRFFMGDQGDNMWENNYGLKLSKGGDD